MLHNNSSLIAISTIPNPTIFEKTLGVNDFYYGESEWAYPLGATQMLGKSDAFTISLDAPNADDPADLAAHPRFLAHNRANYASQSTLSSPTAHGPIANHSDSIGRRVCASAYSMSVADTGLDNGQPRGGKAPATRTKPAPGDDAPGRDRRLADLRRRLGMSSNWRLGRYIRHR